MWGWGKGRGSWLGVPQVDREYLQHWVAKKMTIRARVRDMVKIKGRVKVRKLQLIVLGSGIRERAVLASDQGWGRLILHECSVVFVHHILIHHVAKLAHQLGHRDIGLALVGSWANRGYRWDMGTIHATSYLA